jgi:hypothetical protein
MQPLLDNVPSVRFRHSAYDGAHITLLQQYYCEWHGVPIFEVLLNLAYIYPSQAKPTNIIYY